MSAIKLVIGDRLGKGQKVGAGAETAGASVTIIPGDGTGPELIEATRRVLGLALSASLNAPIEKSRFGVFRM